LIWLARNSISPSVDFGTPDFPTAEDSSWSAFMASGMTTTGLFLLDCMIVYPPRKPEFCFATTVTDRVGET
jgi:hypothetical protein